MKFAISIKTPEVEKEAPLALLSGTFEERLKKAADYGYRGVELIVSDPARLDVQQLLSQLKAHGLVPVAVATGFVAGSRGLTLVSSDENIHARAAALLRELVEFAARLGCELVTIGGFRGRAADAGGSENAKRQIHAALAGADPLAQQLGVTIALEPLRSSEFDLLNNAQEVCDLIDAGGYKAVGLLLDVYHMAEEPDLLDAFRKYRDRLFHVHLADTDRKALGSGKVDFMAIEQTLKELDYTGWQSVELPRGAEPDRNGFLPPYLAAL